LRADIIHQEADYPLLGGLDQQHDVILRALQLAKETSALNLIIRILM
jgi:hypothetical protein